MRAASSNLRELTVLADCIKLWGSEFKPGDRVLYSTDNLTTAKTINSGVSPSDQLDMVAREIHGWAAIDVCFLARWIPGVAIIKEGSDMLSRADQFVTPPRVDWRLAPLVVDHWQQVLGSSPVLPQADDVGPLLRSALKRSSTGAKLKKRKQAPSL